VIDMNAVAVAGALPSRTYKDKEPPECYCDFIFNAHLN